MKTWWQVYYYDTSKEQIQCFGFASIDGVITEHPDWKWRDETIEYYKPFLCLLSNLQVIKICDQLT